MNTDKSARLNAAGNTLSGVCLCIFVATFLFALVAAWPIMIGLGILHGQWNAVPNFGFLAALVLVWGLDLIGTALFRS